MSESADRNLLEHSAIVVEKKIEIAFPGNLDHLRTITLWLRESGRHHEEVLTSVLESLHEASSARCLSKPEVRRGLLEIGHAAGLDSNGRSLYEFLSRKFAPHSSHAQQGKSSPPLDIVHTATVYLIRCLMDIRQRCEAVSHSKEQSPVHRVSAVASTISIEELVRAFQMDDMEKRIHAIRLSLQLTLTEKSRLLLSVLFGFASEIANAFALQEVSKRSNKREIRSPGDPPLSEQIRLQAVSDISWILGPILFAPLHVTQVENRSSLDLSSQTSSQRSQAAIQSWTKMMIENASFLFMESGFARVAHKFEGQDEQEMSVYKGQVIEILRREGNGWVLAQKCDPQDHKNLHSGWVPETYIKEIKEQEYVDALALKIMRVPDDDEEVFVSGVSPNNNTRGQNKQDQSELKVDTNRDVPRSPSMTSNISIQTASSHSMSGSEITVVRNRGQEDASSISHVSSPSRQPPALSPAETRKSESTTSPRRSTKERHIKRGSSTSFSPSAASSTSPRSHGSRITSMTAIENAISRQQSATLERARSLAEDYYRPSRRRGGTFVTSKFNNPIVFPGSKSKKPMSVEMTDEGIQAFSEEVDSIRSDFGIQESFGTSPRSPRLSHRMEKEEMDEVSSDMESSRLSLSKAQQLELQEDQIRYLQDQISFLREEQEKILSMQSTQSVSTSPSHQSQSALSQVMYSGTIQPADISTTSSQQQETFDVVREELYWWKQKCEQLEQTNAELMQSKVSADVRLESLQESLFSLEKKFDDDMTQSLSSREENVKLMEEFSKIQHFNDELQHSESALRSDLAAAKKVIEELRAELSSKTSAVDVDVSDLRTENERLRHEVEHLFEENSLLRKFMDQQSFLLPPVSEPSSPDLYRRSNSDAILKLLHENKRLRSYSDSLVAAKQELEERVRSLEASVKTLTVERNREKSREQNVSRVQNIVRNSNHYPSIESVEVNAEERDDSTHTQQPSSQDSERRDEENHQYLGRIDRIEGPQNRLQKSDPLDTLRHGGASSTSASSVDSLSASKPLTTNVGLSIDVRRGNDGPSDPPSPLFSPVGNARKRGSQIRTPASVGGASMLASNTPNSMLISESDDPSRVTSATFLNELQERIGHRRSQWTDLESRLRQSLYRLEADSRLKSATSANTNVSTFAQSSSNPSLPLPHARLPMHPSVSAPITFDPALAPNVYLQSQTPKFRGNDFSYPSFDQAPTNGVAHFIQGASLTASHSSFDMVIPSSISNIPKNTPRGHLSYVAELSGAYDTESVSGPSVGSNLIPPRLDGSQFMVHGNPISVSRSASFASDEVPFTSFSAPLSRSPPPHRRPPIAPPLSSSQFVSVSNVPASQYSIQPTSAIARGGSESSFPFR